jgi:hypothetical protein
MRNEIPVSVRGFYGEKHARNSFTSLAIRLLVAVDVMSAVLLWLVRPAQGTAVRNWITGAFVMALGGGLFLHLVVETWQTRRLIRFKGGPAVDCEKSPRLYNAILVVFAIACAAMFSVGVSLAVQWPWRIRS